MKISSCRLPVFRGAATRASFVAGAVFLLSRPDLAAQAPPTADEIVSRHIEARGGAEKIRGLRSIVYRGKYRERDHEGDAVMALMRPFYKLVGDPDRPNGSFAEGYDGSAWEYYGDPGFVVRTVGAAAAATRHGLAVDGPLFEYREKGSTVEAAGMETVGGRSAWRLRVTMRDGFAEDEFIDGETWMLIASRKVAPVHAFGPSVASETRFDDFRPVAGVLFPFANREVEIATGRVLSQMEWTSIVANRQIDLRVFSPPALNRTPVQKLLDDLFLERSDRAAVRWSYDEFRRAYPAVDTDAGIQAIGYQILKMGNVETAIALLEANAQDHPRSSGAAFGLGRALGASGRAAEARAAFTRSLALDPGNRRARTALDALKAGPEQSGQGGVSAGRDLRR
jgi:hypothetical protein